MAGLEVGLMLCRYATTELLTSQLLFVIIVKHEIGRY